LAVARDGRHIAYVDRQTTYAIDRLTFDAQGRLSSKPEEVYESSQEIADFDLSPDGKFFAFDSRGGAQDDLFVLGADGTGLRQLTDDAPKDRAPSFSPDGRRLAFHSDRGGRYEIWTIAIDGGGLAQLTRTTGDTVIEPHWAPDGRRMAINRTQNGFILPLDDKGQAGTMEPLASPLPDTSVYPLAWTPDGRRLFASIVRAQDRSTIGLLVYDSVAKTVSQPFRGIQTGGRATRGSALGERLVYRDADGVHVADPAAGTDRLILSHTSAGNYGSIACRGATTCYAVRSSDNADIWQRTMPEAGR
ncbi:MAG: hypothetical protein WAU32_15650, partial [Thermoanaerobaculia bacterium]